MSQISKEEKFRDAGVVFTLVAGILECIARQMHKLDNFDDVYRPMAFMLYQNYSDANITFAEDHIKEIIGNVKQCRDAIKNALDYCIELEAFFELHRFYNPKTVRARTMPRRAEEMFYTWRYVHKLFKSHELEPSFTVFDQHDTTVLLPESKRSKTNEDYTIELSGEEKLKENLKLLQENEYRMLMNKKLKDIEKTIPFPLYFKPTTSIDTCCQKCGKQKRLSSSQV